VPIDNIPFDARKGIVPNTGGRVLSPSSVGSDAASRLYVTGWLRRGIIT